MAPLIVNVSNSSTKPQYVYLSDGKTSFHVTSGTSAIVNDYIDDKPYTKIEVNSDDVRRYLLKSDNKNKILINDFLGVSAKVPDSAIWTKNDEEDVYINICNNTIEISCASQNLRVYLASGEVAPEYYKTVTASHMKTGGIEVKGKDEPAA